MTPTIFALRCYSCDYVTLPGGIRDFAVVIKITNQLILK